MYMGQPTKSKLIICSLIICLTVFLFSACGAGETEEPVASESPTPTETPAQPQETDEAPASQAPGYEPVGFSLYEAYSEDFLLGTIYTPKSISDPDKSLALDQFNCITPENIMKPEYMQPSEGSFKFTESDTMVQFAESNNLKLAGHTLAWHQQSGNWLGQNVSRDEAIEQLRSHITHVVGQYKGKIMAWDVVNEAVSDGWSLPSDGDWTKCLRETQWSKSIGPDYIALAFQFAHEADPDAKLYYNDYNLNEKNKATIVSAMVKDLREQGVPIHGIGMQGHYNTDISIASVEYSLNMFSELDVEVSITELDVPVNAAAGASSLTEEQEVKQAIVYAKLFKLFREHKDIIARVTFWGTIDSASWRSDRFPCLFNDDYSPKEAAYAVLDPDKYLADHGVEVERVVKTAQALYGTPKIDAEIDEVWGSCPEIAVNNPIMAWEGAKGVVRVLWDESFVYCLFEVEDDLLNKLSENPYEHDSIEIFLDQNNGKTPFYEDDDGQYRVNFDNEVSLDTAPDTPGFTSAAKLTSNGYLVELAIPVVVTATEGTVMGFDAQVNDSDDKGVRQSIMKFSDLTDNTWSTLESVADLELVK